MTEFMPFGGPSPDLGERPIDQEKRRKFRPTLVDTGRHKGDSRVAYRGHNIPLHLITKDFFITVVQLDTFVLLSLVGLIYLIVFLIWSFIWWLIVQYSPGCLYGASTYVEALAFSTVTQMTIGYGNTGPQACWAATWLIIIQSVLGVVLEAVTLGIVFARISHPHQRAQSIFISNKAVIARRDGILKFMFRVADIRNAQVVEPKVRAYLYTWGAGRHTTEGERIPVRVEPLEVDYIDGMLLLPLIIEHTIDERSPLCGHTHTSLVGLNAELVVTFEGTTEMGNPFMARRSYIPEEIYWGYQFCNIVVLPEVNKTDYSVNLDSFHEVERQKDMPNLHPSQLSSLVVNRAKKTVPYPLLGENTLVLSDVLCVAPNEDGQLCLYCRVGDTYPNQMLEITGRMYLYRWKSLGGGGKGGGSRDPSMLVGEKKAAPEGETFEQYSLNCGYNAGTDRLYLRLPHLLCHVIDNDSPLASWREEGGLAADSLSEIVVVINAYMNVNTHNILRQRTYAVDHHVRYGHGFAPIVKHPALARDRKPRVRWQHFHDTVPADGMAKFPPPPTYGGSVGQGGSIPSQGQSNASSTAPESHAAMRSLGVLHGMSVDRAFRAGLLPGNAAVEALAGDLSVLPMVDLQRYAAAITEESHTGCQHDEEQSKNKELRLRLQDAIVRFTKETVSASDSLPHPAALHPSIPGADQFRVTDESDFNDKNDYTVLPMDLHRYSVAVTGTDSLPRQRSMSFAPLPADFKVNAQAAAAAAGGSGEIESPSPAGPPDAAAVTLSKDGGGGGRKSDVAGANGKEGGETEQESGLLAGVMPVERMSSRPYTEEDIDEEEEAGPMHFATSKARKTGKSFLEISSLFNRGSNENDLKNASFDEETGHQPKS